MTVDPLARFRGALEKRRPQVFVVGRKSDVRAWAAEARLSEDVTPIASLSDALGRRFLADDVLVYHAECWRLVDYDAVMAELTKCIAASTSPQVMS